jgi:hypothetical protein
MVLTLTPEQSQQWDEGGWLSLEVQETMLEDIERRHITEAVVVVHASGSVCFWVTPDGVVI